MASFSDDLCWLAYDDDDARAEAAAVAAQWIACTPEGCEPAPGDPVAKNRGNFLFAGRDAHRRYQFICTICNYGDLQPFAQAHRKVADVAAAAERHNELVHLLLRSHVPAIRRASQRPHGGSGRRCLNRARARSTS